MPFDLNPPAVQFPLIGNSIAVGIPSLLHIVLAGLSVGFLVLAPIFEWRGQYAPHFTDLARGITKFTVLVFSVSTVLAVIMVELLIGLFPVTTMWIWNQFRGPIALAIGAFLLQFAFLYPYYHFWEGVRRRSVVLHICLGVAAAMLMLIWVAVLDGMGSYMLTPVTGGTTWAHLWNETWVPLGLHRLFGELVMAGYVIAAYGAWRLGRPDAQHHRDYYLLLTNVGWLCGLAALLIQPFSGLLYASSIRRAAPDAYEQVMRGQYQVLAYIQFALIGLLMLGNHWLVKACNPDQPSPRWLDVTLPVTTALMVASVGHPMFRRSFLYLLMGLTVWSIGRSLRRAHKGRPFDAGFGRWMRAVALALGALSVLTYMTMGTIRETARRPDTVRHVISLNDEAAYPAADRGNGKEADSLSMSADGKE